MDFENRECEVTEYSLHRQEGSSRTELVFIPGPMNPELWKNQVRYFSNQFTVSTYRTEGGYRSERAALEDILDNVENAVLVSYGPGNSLSQYFEDRENVIATVLVNASEGISIPERTYRIFSRTVWRKPKLVRKLFFGPASDYSTVREFLEDLEVPSYDKFRSYTESFGLREPLKDAMFISASNDRFSKVEFARELKANAGIGILEGAGTFPFYEKPEDFNKALFDFLVKVEDFAESRAVREAREENKTLDEEFKDSSLERFAKQRLAEE